MVYTLHTSKYFYFTSEISYCVSVVTCFCSLCTTSTLIDAMSLIKVFTIDSLVSMYRTKLLEKWEIIYLFYELFLIGWTKKQTAIDQKPINQKSIMNISLVCCWLSVFKNQNQQTEPIIDKTKLTDARQSMHTLTCSSISPFPYIIDPNTWSFFLWEWLV